jgi:hypothetical protein
MEHKTVLTGTKKGSTWTQKGFSYGDGILESFFLRVYYELSINPGLLHNLCDNVKLNISSVAL